MADIYVVQNGNDANLGDTWTSAKKTICAAFSSANNNDSIFISGGDYIETETLTLSGKNNISVIGKGKVNIKFNYAYLGDYAVSFLNASTNITLKNLSF